MSHLIPYFRSRKSRGSNRGSNSAEMSLFEPSRCYSGVAKSTTYDKESCYTVNLQRLACVANILIFQSFTSLPETVGGSLGDHVAIRPDPLFFMAARRPPVRPPARLRPEAPPTLIGALWGLL